MSEGKEKSTVNVYVIRHAESRYNSAKRNHNISQVVGETDHGLSDEGVRQCFRLNSAIRSAAASGCPDGKLILSREVTLSSPLSRAILTAHLALPMREMGDGEEKTSDGNDSNEEEKKEQQRHHRVVALAEAREHCLMPVFCQDSVGTPREQIDLKVAAELSAAKKIDEKNNIDSSPSLVVDTSRIAIDIWWNVGEKSSCVSERLGKLLHDLYDEAGGSGGDDENNSNEKGAVVLVAHSRVIRALIRDFGDEKVDGKGSDDAKISTLSEMKERLIDNCAVVRLTVEASQSQCEKERATPPPRIVDAAFLFGTGFVQEKPKKKSIWCF